jgi:hypothetical protein
MAKKVGRPKIELKDLPKGWKETIIKLSSQGASIVELAVELEISRDTFYALSDRDEHFKKAVCIFKEVSKKINRVNPSKKVLKLREKRKKSRNYKKEYNSNKFSISARNLLSYHLRNNGKTKSKKTFEYFGYSPKEYVNNINLKLKEGMTLDNYGLWHVDHIKPLSKFDLTKDEEIKKAWAFDNLQCLWASENISKGNRYEER